MPELHPIEDHVEPINRVAPFYSRSDTTPRAIAERKGNAAEEPSSVAPAADSILTLGFVLPIAVVMLVLIAATLIPGLLVGLLFILVGLAPGLVAVLGLLLTQGLDVTTGAHR